ncbi:hypothetical protein bcCo53_001442 (plasmid) [Borrelia coriaceae]|nr:hypothetical protein [Borrelia coriaceae]UPA17264.1 hypothetical protein bcCo53_001442 [Borrelia coriaceae]
MKQVLIFMFFFVFIVVGFARSDGDEMTLSAVDTRGGTVKIICCFIK